jgi:hypothetical protein
MSAVRLQLSLLPQTLAICRLPSEARLPTWATQGAWYAVARTAEELSIVCEQGLAPDEVRQEMNWRALKVAGPLDFGLTGILAALAGPLAEAGLSLFAVSTFDTDYVLVKAEQLPEAIRVLRAAGHTLGGE